MTSSPLHSNIPDPTAPSAPGAPGVPPAALSTTTAGPRGGAEPEYENAKGCLKFVVLIVAVLVLFVVLCVFIGDFGG